MASYAALLSLQTLIHTIKNHHNPPISLHIHHHQLLLQNITFLQQLLASCGDDHPMDGLDARIIAVVHAAEDLIETYVVDQIEGFVNNATDCNRGHRFHQDMDKLIKDMDVIMQQAINIKYNMGDDDDEDRQHMSSASVLSPSIGKKGVMVGFDNVLNALLHKLTGQPQSSLQIIPIVGMGGIGKTTLAVNAFEHSHVMHHFDILIWVTVSQTYNAREILIDVLSQREQVVSQEEVRKMSEDDIGEKIYKSFSGWRYLIVMDDAWDVRAWDEIKRFFPNNNNGSRMIVTTRDSNVATKLTRFSGFKMDFLDEDKSWDLLRKVVFKVEEDSCPLELEVIGKTIAKNCNGLPLSIVVIGGFLAKSELSKQHWEYVARNLSLIVNVEDEERCTKVLQMSYRHLPIHLKSCFMYIGIYPEDESILVSDFAKLLAGEGILKPIDGKTTEEVAKKYIVDLVDRNLLLVDTWGSTGSVKACRIHDLLRDLCIREAERENFLHVMGEHNLDVQEDINARRIVVRRIMRKSQSNDESLEEAPFPTHGQDTLQSSTLARSLKWELENCLPPFTFRFLRLLNANHTNLDEHFQAIFQLYNSRFMCFGVSRNFLRPSLHSMTHLWNLQTLIIGRHFNSIEGGGAIWKMPQLRHVKVVNLQFDHPCGDNLVLENLQTLSRMSSFVCTKEVVTKIPNIQKLGINIPWGAAASHQLNNLEHLHELQHVTFRTNGLLESDGLHKYVTFPASIKKLSLTGPSFCWENITLMAGSLPYLEVLKLHAVLGTEWSLDEGQFPSLKFLEIRSCNALELWSVESESFPLLRCIVLKALRKLELPSCIGEFPTLELIKVIGCREPVVSSAKRIIEEQEDLGNSDIRLYIQAERQYLKTKLMR